VSGENCGGEGRVRNGEENAERNEAEAVEV